MRVEFASGKACGGQIKGRRAGGNHTLQTIDPPKLPSRLEPTLFEVPLMS